MKIHLFIKIALIINLCIPVYSYSDNCHQIVTQANIGKYACGPCSILNAIIYGNNERSKLLQKIEGKSNEQKVKSLIEKYGQKPSVEYNTGHRYRKTGMASYDLLAFANDFQTDYNLPKLEGNFLNRIEGEDLNSHLKRIHLLLKNSISNKTPIITYFRSFAPQYNVKEKEFQWEGLAGHYVVIVEVEDQINNNQKGFSFKFLDSSTGKVEYGYIYYDEARNFTAAKGNTEKLEWLRNRPFLLVNAPSLRLNTQNTDWYLRTTIVLNFAIYHNPYNK